LGRITCDPSAGFVSVVREKGGGLVDGPARWLVGARGKTECVWQRSFPSFIEARRAVRRWIGWYNERRPYQALGYLSPRQYRALQLERVA
jgi:hypothetical protein